MTIHGHRTTLRLGPPALPETFRGDLTKCQWCGYRIEGDACPNCGSPALTLADLDAGAILLALCKGTGVSYPTDDRIDVPESLAARHLKEHGLRIVHEMRVGESA